MNTSDKLAFAALGISIFTAIFACYSFLKTDELSKNAFNRNYRPYLVAANFSYIDQKDGLMYPNMNILLIRIFNAPALVSSKKLSFYVRDNDTDTLLFEHPEYKDELLYPLDNSQYSINTDANTISHSLAEELYPKQIVRKVRIEYQWISDSTLKYFFQSDFVYDIKKRDWNIITQSAN